MTDISAQLRDAVFGAIDELNQLRPSDQQIAKSLDTTLTGEHGPLDSLGFVNLIVAIEQRLDSILTSSVSLLDDEMLDPTAGHFRTVGAMIEYLKKIRVEQSSA